MQGPTATQAQMFARTGSRLLWKAQGPYLFALPATLLFAVFIAYPILWVAGQSVWTKSTSGLQAFAGLAHYGVVLADPTFWIVVRNMFLWGAITIPVQMLIGGRSPISSSVTPIVCAASSGR